MLTIKKINNEKITVIPVKKVNPKQIKGYSIIPLLYANILISAFKNSGKTNVINKIIEECIDVETKVVVFCSTHNNDDNWLYIKKYFEKKKIGAVFYTSLIENGIDQLTAFVDFLIAQGEAKLIEEGNNKKQNINDCIEIIKFNNGSEAKIKIKPKKKIAPEYLIVFDDMGMELKKRNITDLLKTFRHYHAKVIVSTQYLKDLAKDGRSQIDFFLLFKGHAEKNLEDMYSDFGCNMDFDTFYQIYRKVTDERFNFLYIDKPHNQLRQNFDSLIEIEN